MTEPIKQPEALRLADVPICQRSLEWQSNATAELRLLHGEVDALRAIVRGKVVIRKVWVDEAGDIQWELVNPEKEPK